MRSFQKGLEGLYGGLRKTQQDPKGMKEPARFVVR